MPVHGQVEVAEIARLPAPRQELCNGLTAKYGVPTINADVVWAWVMVRSQKNNNIKLTFPAWVTSGKTLTLPQFPGLYNGTPALVEWSPRLDQWRTICEL